MGWLGFVIIIILLLTLHISLHRQLDSMRQLAVIDAEYARLARTISDCALIQLAYVSGVADDEERKFQIEMVKGLKEDLDRDLVNKQYWERSSSRMAKLKEGKVLPLKPLSTKENVEVVQSIEDDIFRISNNFDWLYSVWSQWQRQTGALQKELEKINWNIEDKKQRNDEDREIREEIKKLTKTYMRDFNSIKTKGFIDIDSIVEDEL